MSDPKYEPIATEVYRRRDYLGGRHVHAAETPGPEMLTALDMLQRWGMVAAVDDGEDKAGRAKIRLATPDELVELALWKSCSRGDLFALKNIKCA